MAMRWVSTTPRGVESMASIGRRYETACLSMLYSIGITLQHVGGRNDKGIDLTGHWGLSETPTPVIVQCKNLKRDCPPVVVRELEGVASKKKGHLAILVTSSPASRASIEAIKLSPWPMLFLQYDMVKLQRAFSNTAMQRMLPGLVIGTRHIHGGAEPAFFYSD